MMQAGFATLSAGSIRAKNVKNILLKNVLDACVGAIVWYCVGYGLAYDADNGVNGPCNAASRDTLIGPGSVLSVCVLALVLSRARRPQG
jgi:Amt family ammonium transporter